MSPGPAIARRAPSPGTAISVHIPAPVGGLNTISPASEMPEGDCPILWNMIGSEYGLRSRLGSRDWGLTVGGSSEEFRTMLPFAGAASASDKLFAVGTAGIYNATAKTGGLSLVSGGTFPIQSGDAGYGVGQVRVTSAGHFLPYCDEANGLYVYTSSTDTWAAVAQGVDPGQISGVDPRNLVYFCEWKNRSWFVERDTTKAWYLAAGALYGAATSFDFGSRFKAGGYLVGLWNWTVDGGIGIDDYLVAISSGGDVVIYKGTDPSSASTFAIKGVWQIAPPPRGRNIATTIGGDLLILSRLGVVPLSQLVNGSSYLSQDGYVTHKVANLFQALTAPTWNMRGWGIYQHPEDASLIITVPTQPNESNQQLVMSLATKGWSRYRDLDMLSAASWQGKLYFGTRSGRVRVNTGYLDNVSQATDPTYDAIEWALLTSFSNLGNARQKRVSIIRPTILCDGGTPAYAVAARFKYDMSEISSIDAAAAAGWDTGLWDTELWAGDYATTQAANGATGVGVDLAIAVRGTATARTVFVGTDVMFQTGGYL